MGDLVRMPHFKKNKKVKPVRSEIDTFLTTGMGVFSWFNEKKIKFTPKPLSEKKKLDELLQDYRFDDVSFVIKTLLELKNIDVLQELFNIQVRDKYQIILEELDNLIKNNQ